MRNYPKNRQSTPVTKSSTNTSGIIGVALVPREYPKLKTRSVGYTYSWAAVYRCDGKVCIVKFGVKKYGEKEAFKMACRERYKHSGKVIILDKKKIPCLPDVEYEIKK